MHSEIPTFPRLSAALLSTLRLLTSYTYYCQCYQYSITTTTILWPFFRDHPDEPVPEENFWTLWCKGRLTEADTLTIWMGATPSGRTSAHLHHPPIFLQAGCPSCRPNNSIKAPKAILYKCRWIFYKNDQNDLTSCLLKSLKMICNDFLVVKVNCWSYVFNITKCMWIWENVKNNNIVEKTSESVHRWFVYFSQVMTSYQENTTKQPTECRMLTTDRATTHRHDDKCRNRFLKHKRVK